jgi:SAM-dependent methyltransferase
MLEVPSEEQKPHAVREMARVLKPGGRVYLTTLNRRYGRASVPQRVTLEQLRELLSPGFHCAIKGFNPCPPFPYFLPNRVLARVPGIWRILTALMDRNIGINASCMFYVEGVRK